MRTRRFTLAVALLAAAALAACTSGQAAPPGDRPGTASCTSAEYGYTLAYPAAWYTEPENDYPACQVFHPEPFSVPIGGEATHFGATIGVTAEPYETVVRWATDAMYERVLTRDETTVAGRPAVIIESEATGEGLLDRGTLTYRYVVDLGERGALDASTRSGEGLQYDENRAVLDGMMQSLELAGP